MRKFSTIEKEVIKYIVSRDRIESMSFSTLFLRLMPTLAIEQTERGLRIYCKASDGKLDSLMQPYIKRLLDILFLINYLNDNALIGIFHMKGEESKILYSKNYKKVGNEFYEIKDDEWQYRISTNYFDYYTDCGDLLFHYIKSCFHASETLRDLAKNGFKDEDTLRFSKNMFWTRMAVITSIVIGLTSIIFTLKSLNQTATINPEQLDEIKIELRNISTTLKNQPPVIINSIIEKDTSRMGVPLKKK